jgi:hypothetical protein
VPKPWMKSHTKSDARSRIVYRAKSRRRLPMGLKEGKVRTNKGQAKVQANVRAETPATKVTQKYGGQATNLASRLVTMSKVSINQLR